MKPSQVLEMKIKEQNIAYPRIKIVEFLEKNNGEHLDDTAIKYYGNNISYGRLFEEIDAYSRAFASFGVGEGDYVSVCLPSIPEALYIMYALNKLGAVYHSVLPTASPEQVAGVLRANQAKVFVTLDSLYGRVGAAAAAVPVKVRVSANSSLPGGLKQLKYARDAARGKFYGNIPKEYLSVSRFKKNGAGTEFTQSSWKEGSVAIITSSSGSTATKNKATMLTDYGFNAMATNYKIAFPQLHRGQTFHSCIPILYATGASNSVNLPLQLGFTTILEPVFNRDLYPSAFMSHKPNLSIVPPPHAKSLLNFLRKIYGEGNKNRELLSFVDVYSVGGAHMPVPWETELEDYLHYYGSSAAIGKGYGLSEHNSALTGSLCRMIGAAGMVLPGVIMAVFDPVTGEELDFGQEGQIRAISPADMSGYFAEEELTNEYFRRGSDGRKWGHTGDIGRLELIDGEVWFFYSGREKDMVTVDGRNILLAKLQSKVFECGDIDDCEVVMVDLGGGPVPAAHIVLKSEIIKSEAVLEKLNAVFGESDIPEPFAYKIHKALPVLISGKADKHTLLGDKTGYIKYTDGKIGYIMQD